MHHNTFLNYNSNWLFSDRGTSVWSDLPETTLRPERSHEHQRSHVLAAIADGFWNSLRRSKRKWTLDRDS